MEVSKQDWKCFREKLPCWQESYMEGLIQEYRELLDGEENASEKFWELEKRIQQDRRSRGVILSLRKDTMLFDIASFLHEGVITMSDLEGFSNEVREAVQNLQTLFSERMNQCGQ